MSPELRYCVPGTPRNSKAYHQALELIPEDAVDDLAVTHNALGVIYDNGNKLDRALRHWQEAIRYQEAAGNPFRAGETRSNVANALAKRERFPDSLEYAKAALRDFEPYGAGAAGHIQNVKRLIAKIEELNASGNA